MRAARVHAVGHAGPEKGGSDFCSSQSKDEIFKDEVWTGLDLTLAPGWFPWSPNLPLSLYFITQSLLWLIQ